MRIRPLEGHGEYLEAEALQREVWGFPDREVIPLNELVVAQNNGGLVFGAFEGRRMAAFCFGVPGYADGRVYHYSRMLGVRPGARNRGLGLRMKRFQRAFVLRQGLDLVRWTFDPLQSRNAWLNVGRLGCVVRKYLVNVYGESGSRFNRGLETDRFVPEWWIRSRRVADHLVGRAPRPSVEEVLALPPAGRWRERRVAVEIPPDIDALKAEDGPSARRWRFRTRRLFGEAFARGFAVTGFATGRSAGGLRSAYVLEKEPRVR